MDANSPIKPTENFLRRFRQIVEQEGELVRFWTNTGLAFATFQREGGLVLTGWHELLPLPADISARIPQIVITESIDAEKAIEVLAALLDLEVQALRLASTS